MEPFQAKFLEDLFAGIPECWFIVPEGNAKTTLVAGLALYVCEFTPGKANVPVAASSREQAGILYSQAESFVLNSPALHDTVRSELQAIKGKLKLDVPRFKPLPGYRKIDHYRGGVVQVFAADDRTGDGVIFRLGILDELHRHRDLSLYRTWAGKMLKREGSQIIAISTAGEPGSEFETTRALIRRTTPVVERTPTFLRARGDEMVLHEYAVPEDGDVEDIALVKRANPLRAITLERLAKKRRRSTMTLSHWARFTCNLAMRSDLSAITDEEWRQAETTERIPAGVPIYVGLDVAWKWDTTALVPLLRRQLSDEEVEAIRSVRGEREAEAIERELCLLGVADVLLPPRNGNSLDPDKVEAAFLALHRRNPIHTVVMDMSRAEQLASWIETEIGARVIDRSQTNDALAKDCEKFLEGLRNRVLRHVGDPVLTRHALNAVAKALPDERWKFVRPAVSRTESEGTEELRVIDALAAAAMVYRFAREDVPAEAEPLVAFA